MRARVTVVFAGAIFLLLTLVGAGLLFFTRFSTTSRDETLLRATAAGIRTELASGVVSTRAPQKFINAVGWDLNATGVALLIIDNDRVVARSTKRVPSWPNTSGWLIHSVPDEGGRRIILAHSTEENEHELRRLAFALFTLGSIVWAAATLGAWVLVGRVLSPIDQLAETARRAPIDASRLEAPSNDAEVVRLVGTLNGFLARLHESNRAKERFYAAASHELRTPLQGLAGFLEIGLSRPRSQNDLVSLLGEAQEQSAKLVKLTSDLLALNQLETSTIKADNEWLDAPDAFERALHPLEGQRKQKGITVTCDWPEHVEDAEIFAPWSHLEMLARNLCENAIKYSPEGGNVRISLANHQLCVQNDTDKPVDVNLERLFEPFYRPDTSRGAKTGGNGLGLTICKAICDANNWDIKLRVITAGQQTLDDTPVNSNPRNLSSPSIEQNGLEVTIHFNNSKEEPKQASAELATQVGVVRKDLP